MNFANRRKKREAGKDEDHEPIDPGAAFAVGAVFWWLVGRRYRSWGYAERADGLELDADPVAGAGGPAGAGVAADELARRRSRKTG